MESSKLKVEYCEFIPESPLSGVLYISNQYLTSCHLCPCGCGNEIHLPFNHQNWWTMKDNSGVITFNPSIGNWKICGSHYWIRENMVVWE